LFIKLISFLMYFPLFCTHLFYILEIKDKLNVKQFCSTSTFKCNINILASMGTAKISATKGKVFASNIVDGVSAIF